MFILNVNGVMVFLIIFLTHEGFSMQSVRAVRDEGSSSAPPVTQDEKIQACYEAIVKVFDAPYYPSGRSNGTPFQHAQHALQYLHLKVEDVKSNMYVRAYYMQIPQFLNPGGLKRVEQFCENRLLPEECSKMIVETFGFEDPKNNLLAAFYNYSTVTLITGNSDVNDFFDSIVSTFRLDENPTEKNPLGFLLPNEFCSDLIKNSSK